MVLFAFDLKIDLTGRNTWHAICKARSGILKFN